MTAEVRTLPRPGSGGRAPLVPNFVNVQSADGCMFDLDYSLSSSRAARMPPEQFGVWTRLHMRANKEEHAGTLPDDDEELAFYAGYGCDGVDRFRAIKAKVMADWVLCADGRWHHPMRAKNVLHIWIARRETDRKSAIGNGAKSAEVRSTIQDIEGDIEAGAAALRALNPRDQFLLKLDARISKWPNRMPPAIDADAVPDASAALTAADNPSHGGRKRSEAKRSESPSSPRSGDDSGLSDNFGEREIEGAEAPPPEPGLFPEPEPPERWPRDALDRFKTVYPRGRNWGDAEKALERIRKAGKVPFSTVMAGVGRLVAEGGDPKFIPYPASWLNARGWENAPDPPRDDGGPPGGGAGRARWGADSADAGITSVIQHLRSRPPNVDGAPL